VYVGSSILHEEKMHLPGICLICVEMKEQELVTELEIEIVYNMANMQRIKQR
jgi:hypothetical protein